MSLLHLPKPSVWTSLPSYPIGRSVSDEQSEGCANCVKSPSVKGAAAEMLSFTFLSSVTLNTRRLIFTCCMSPAHYPRATAFTALTPLDYSLVCGLLNRSEPNAQVCYELQLGTPYFPFRGIKQKSRRSNSHSVRENTTCFQHGTVLTRCMQT